MRHGVVRLGRGGAGAGWDRALATVVGGGSRGARRRRPPAGGFAPAALRGRSASRPWRLSLRRERHRIGVRRRRRGRRRAGSVGSHRVAVHEVDESTRSRIARDAGSCGAAATSLDGTTRQASLGRRSTAGQTRDGPAAPLRRRIGGATAACNAWLDPLASKSARPHCRTVFRNRAHCRPTARCDMMESAAACDALRRPRHSSSTAASSRHAIRDHRRRPRQSRPGRPDRPLRDAARGEHRRDPDVRPRRGVGLLDAHARRDRPAAGRRARRSRSRRSAAARGCRFAPGRRRDGAALPRLAICATYRHETPRGRAGGDSRAARFAPRPRRSSAIARRAARSPTSSACRGTSSATARATPTTSG